MKASEPSLAPDAQGRGDNWVVFCRVQWPRLILRAGEAGRSTVIKISTTNNISFIRRIRKSGKITIASEKFEIDAELAWDYVYAAICVKEQVLNIYHQGKLIKRFPYVLKLSQNKRCAYTYHCFIEF